MPSTHTMLSVQAKSDEAFRRFLIRESQRPHVEQESERKARIDRHLRRVQHDNMAADLCAWCFIGFALCVIAAVLR